MLAFELCSVAALTPAQSINQHSGYFIHAQVPSEAESIQWHAQPDTPCPGKGQTERMN